MCVNDIRGRGRREKIHITCRERERESCQAYIEREKEKDDFSLGWFFVLMVECGFGWEFGEVELLASGGTGID